MSSLLRRLGYPLLAFVSVGVLLFALNVNYDCAGTFDTGIKCPALGGARHPLVEAVIGNAQLFSLIVIPVFTFVYVLYALIVIWKAFRNR